MVIAFLVFTNPQNLPLILLILPLLLFFVALFLTVRSILAHLDGGINRANARYRTVLAATISAFPVMCLLLQSIGQFSARDFVTISILFGILIFYINRMKVTT